MKNKAQENENNKKMKKNNKKARKIKKKKSLFGKIMKVILIILLIAVVTYGVWFGFQYFRHTSNMGEAKYDPLSATALGIDPEKLKSTGRINILILGESGVGDGYKLTDSIMIASYDPQTQDASLLSIPRDTYVGKKNKDTASANYLASYKMNAVYRNGTNIPETIECVNNLTGLDMEYYVLIDTDAIIDVVDAIGGVTFTVPIDMKYDDPTQDLHIDLKAGEQVIDGEKAEQLLRFRHNNDGSSYPEEYGDNDIGRMRTQREFVQTTAKQLLRIENVTKVLDLMNIVFKNVKTNLDLTTLKYYIPYIFKFNMENLKTSALPGVPEQCNGIWIYTANKKQTTELIEEMFFSSSTSDEENGNVIDGTNTVNSNTTTSQTTNTSKTTKLEVLNGTGNSSILTAVTKKLEKEGYTVTKSGTTSTTSKTTIINRTSQSSTKENKIKEILGLGTVSTGSNNSNVDFTIIIGKDYE